MAFTYNGPSTDAGKVRLLIPDKDVDNGIFQDDEIDGLLAMEGSVKGATALALETIASDTVMVEKVIKTLNLQTDGAKASDALLKRAAMLRAQAAAERAMVDDGAGYFEVSEWVIDDFSYRERAWNAALRG